MTIWREREEKTGSSMLVGELGYFVLLLYSARSFAGRVLVLFRISGHRQQKSDRCQNVKMVCWLGPTRRGRM